MTIIDWIIILGLNGVVFGYGIVRSRKTKTNVDWFLAGRSLPFWVVGVSMFATNVDSGDYVSINGMTYSNGISVFTVWWLGINVAYVIAAFLIVPPMYRAGLFTNSEYLEARFGAATRIISALVQIQYRTNILANVTISLHLLLAVVMGLSFGSAWLVAIGFAVAASLYSAWGGLRVVAWADALLSITMVVSTLILWATVWLAVGGWDGAVAQLTVEGGEELPKQLLHIGVSRAGDPHPLIVVAAWIIISTGYAIVNHSQVMKLFGARSIWDLKMSVIVAGAMTMVMMYFCGSLGILGRAFWPETLSRPDEIYPLLVREMLGIGVKGLVVAGVLAAAISTYQGIGSALSAVFTRDVYARFLAPNKADSHYLMVSRLMTPAIVTASLAYIPFILRFENMTTFYVRVTSVFVTPLMTVYLMGAFTRAHRESAIPGLVVGGAYGLVALIGGTHDSLPDWFVNTWTSYLWSPLFTAIAMLLVSRFLKDRLVRDEAAREATGWQQRSTASMAQVVSSPFAQEGVPGWASPILWAGILIAVASALVFYFFW
ncbi:hypothetical protein MYX78_04035 [Acidobacteria bacterium AH-259-G07]|nr:hypothetical protein [Acidobacteria bacterium AH-259-G07]